MGSERDCSVGIASRAGWEHFPQAETTVLAVKTDKVDLKANHRRRLIHIYFGVKPSARRHRQPGWRDARRIAANIAELPKLMGTRSK
jgi:hypothetical protein